MVRKYNPSQPKTKFTTGQGFQSVSPKPAPKGMSDMEFISPEFTWSPHSLCKDMGMTPSELDKVKNMSDVPSQKRCGSCWAIATVGAIADNLLVAGVLPNNKRPVLSATYALMGGNNKCKIMYTNGTSKEVPCKGGNPNVTWEQQQCGGGSSGYLLSLVASYGIPETICSDYSWCEKSDTCNPDQDNTASPSTSDMNALIPKSGDGPSCYNSTQQPFFKIRFEGSESNSNQRTDRTTGAISVNSSTSEQTYFRFVCKHIRSNGPAIGSFLPFANFDNGAHAFQTYIDGTVRKDTPWKGIYLEQIDYPGGSNLTNVIGGWSGEVPKGECYIKYEDNKAYGSAWGNCLVSTNLRQLKNYYSQANQNSSSRFVLSDIDTALMSKKVFNGCKYNYGSVNYDTVYYIGDEGQTSSNTSGGLVEPQSNQNRNGYYPYSLSIQDGHAAVIMGWGAEYIDWPICQSQDGNSIEVLGCEQSYCKKLVKFWYVRNSWDVNWGDSGYCRIAWYITPEERANGKVGNVYTQFDYGYIYTTQDQINEKGPGADCNSFGPASGGGMLLFSGFDDQGNPIKPTWDPCGSDEECTVDNINYTNEPDGLIHPLDWYENQEKDDIRTPSYKPLTNSPSICNDMTNSTITLPPMGGGDSGGGSGGESEGRTDRNSKNRGNRSADGDNTTNTGLSKKKKSIIITFCIIAAILAIVLCIIVAK